MILSEDSVSFASLSVRLQDRVSWDPDDLAFALTPGASAQTGTGFVHIFMWEVFVPITLRVNYEPALPTMADSLPGRVTLSSGELWIDEIEHGGKRSGATVEPGNYAVHVAFPPSPDDPQIYTVTLFDRQDLGVA